MRAIPQTLNLTLSAAVFGAMIMQMIAMPLFLHDHPAVMVAIVLILIPLNTPFWSLIHEAVHKNLHPEHDINETLGRVMSIVFGAGFDVLRFGHLMHHQYNREWESEIFYPNQNKTLAYLIHYSKMLGGLYFTEIVTSFLIAISPLKIAQKIARSALPDERHRQAALQGLLKPRIAARLRVDSALIIVFHAYAFMLFGANWWVLVLMIAGRAIIISLMDNAYHYGTPADNSVIAKELKVPRPIAAFILNFNHHATHHRNTGLPWTELKEQHDMQDIGYTQDLASALFVQFKGPISKTADQDRL